MVANHAQKKAARARSAETGQSYQTALRDIVHPPFTVYVFDLPTPDLDGDRPCPDCQGGGAKTNEWSMQTYKDRPVHIQIACPGCRGCGRADHIGCGNGSHAGEAYGPPAFPSYNSPEEAEAAAEARAGRFGHIPASACMWCGGRRFRYIDNSDKDLFGNTIAEYLRMPCGKCAEDLMRAEVVRLA
ncbi:MULTISPECIES: hypothetical protein [unclassified Streptomyces]|uniref:hypothetical protein n=1 Tax=unclassified Streptomyces TaxID=2593676 RepID=UPI0008DCB45F|nr:MULTISPECIES: hypothetical protein [unclassified Streptomyces]OII68635.1 hypothetical protein BJP39_20660 [Streptomyces sp. CC77]